MTATGRVLILLSQMAGVAFWCVLIFGGPDWLVVTLGVVWLPGEMVVLTRLNVTRWRRWRERRRVPA